jgi:hypothetical protein
VIGTSGTILSLGTVAATAARGGPPPELRNLRIPAKQIRKLRKEIVHLDAEQRLMVPGLDPRRADLVVGGAVLLDTILRRLGAEDLTLCDLALREGLVLDYIRRNAKTIAQVDKIPDVRRRSTWSWRSGATTTPSTRSRSFAWRSRCSIKRGACTGSPIESANGSSTPRFFTTSAVSSASPAIIATRTT